MSASPVQLLRPHRHEDARGWFAETYNRERFAELGIDCDFVQDNHSLSGRSFTVRGLHFQLPPQAQAKLVRCIRGRIFDVAVDIRLGSPTYGEWVGAELSAENGHQLFIPVGFAHGFMTLEPDCEVIYKCSHVYAAQADGGVRWDDPDIGVAWPVPADAQVVVSQKDEIQPHLAQFHSPFPFDGQTLTELK